MSRLERLLSELGWLSEQPWLDGQARDEIAHLRFLVDERIDEQEVGV